MHSSATPDHQTTVAEKGSSGKSTYLSASRPADDRADDLPRRRAVIMSRFKHIGLVLFALALLAVTLVGASGSTAPRRAAVLSPEAQRFRELLDTVDATTLHEILREHFKDKYQPGVYQEDKTALETLHSQNAEVAHSLVRLAKRQANGGTNNTAVTTTSTTTTTTTTTTTNVPSSSTTTAESTPDDRTTTSTTSESPVSPTTTTTPTLTSSSTSTTTSESSSDSSSSSSPSSTPSTTTSVRSTTLASSSSRRASTTEDVTVEIVYTTILANGAPSIVTRYTVVPADQAAQSTGASTGTGNASLQTNLASPQHRQDGWTAGLGFLGFAAAWIL